MFLAVVKPPRLLRSIVLLSLIAGACLPLVGCAKSMQGGEADMASRNVCPDNPQFCENGACCGTECIDTRLNARNCGGCGIQCEAGTVCSNGKCGCLPTGTACGSGQSCCGNQGCKSLSSDIKNCGGCGQNCGDGATCENGACLCNGVTCASGQTCCGGVCAASCSTLPDMATGGCVCASGCPLSGICVGPNCCFEDFLLGGACSVDPNCVQSMP